MQYAVNTPVTGRVQNDAGSVIAATNRVSDASYGESLPCRLFGIHGAVMQ